MQLPRDEAPHTYPVEWWYFNGHLVAYDTAGHEHAYGYEFVIFQFAAGKNAQYYGNFSLTDRNRKSFRFGFAQYAGPIPASKNGFVLHTGTWTMSGGPGGYKLSASLPHYDLTLYPELTSRAVLHGKKGIIPFGPFGTSAYYSRMHLNSAGLISDHGVTMNATGTSWMDHQWGNIDFASGAGWDWDSVQLSNGQQYMLYFIRNKAGKIVQTIGTRVAPGHKVTHLAAGTFAEKTLGSWTSPATKIRYSSGWQVDVPGGKLTISPDVLNQELDLLKTPQGVAYWEGDTSIKGTINGKHVRGEGYTEINPPAADYPKAAAS